MGEQAGWLPDPTGRHEYRWWDGTRWTEVVADEGVEGVDPLTAPAAPRPQAQPQPQPQPTYPQHRHGGPPPQPQHHQQHRSGPSPVALGVLATALVALVVAIVVVVTRGSGDDDDGGGGGDGNGSGDQVAAIPPREALVTIDDMPTGWTEAETSGAPGEDKVCEPRLEPPEPPRESRASFDRSQPPGALGHTIIETTPDFAADYVDEALRQADTCGTFTDEHEFDGASHPFTATSDVITGPTFSDETIWYTIHLEYEEATLGAHDVLICIDRLGGVVSEIVLSTSTATSENERAMVEDLIRVASDRLQGGASD